MFGLVRRITGTAAKKLKRRAADERMAAAAKFLRQKLYEVLGVQAPRRRTRSGSWRATVRATPGAPPRRVVGTGQAGVEWRLNRERNVSFYNVMFYMMWWESHGHPWFKKTVLKYLREAEKIAGCRLKLSGDWTVARA